MRTLKRPFNPSWNTSLSPPCQKARSTMWERTQMLYLSDIWEEPFQTRVELPGDYKGMSDPGQTGPHCRAPEL